MTCPRFLGLDILREASMDLLFIDLKLDSNFTSLVADEVSAAFGSL